MMPVFAAALVLTLVVFSAVLYGVHSRMKSARASSGRELPSADRYRPMLRLLYEDSVAGNTRAFRARRRGIFRQYLRGLTRDYSQLLQGLRVAMTARDLERPELARALSHNRVLFIRTMFRVEIALAAHALGVDLIRVPDLSGLIAGFDALRAQASSFEPVYAGAR